MTLTSNRWQQSVHAAISAMNRDAGSGGGSGDLPMTSLGSAQGSAFGNFYSGSATTWIDVSALTFTIQVNRPTVFLYLIHAAASTNRADQISYVRGNIIGTGTTRSLSYITGGSILGGSMWLYPDTSAILPGTYTVKLQVANDTSAGAPQNFLTLQYAVHQFFDLGD